MSTCYMFRQKSKQVPIIFVKSLNSHAILVGHATYFKRKVNLNIWYNFPGNDTKFTQKTLQKKKKKSLFTHLYTSVCCTTEKLEVTLFSPPLQVTTATAWMPLLCSQCASCLRAISQITVTSWTIYLSEAIFFLFTFRSLVTSFSIPLLICVWTLLFRYVIGTLELLVAENYMIVYLNGATSRKRMPTMGWLRKCYQQIDRRWGSLGCSSHCHGVRLVFSAGHSIPQSIPAKICSLLDSQDWTPNSHPLPLIWSLI